MRRLQIVFCVVLIAAATAPARGAAPGSVSGVVRDSAGVPQIGAAVQLLRPDLSVIAEVYTGASGHFSFPSLMPGRYAIKAMGTSFLPSLRENVRVRTSTVVNLTLNTLYEVMQWLPARPRAANAPKDDWAWTLRSAANRPLLRWLEDGPLVVVSEGPGSRPRLKARLVATGQEGTFGESGERLTASVEETPSDSRELLAQVDFAPGTDAGMESMLGFRQDLGFAGAVQSVAAVSIHPEIDGSNGEGLDEAVLRSSENINLGDEFDVEAGTEQVVARFGQNSPNTVIAALPFASAGWHTGNSTVRYRMASVPTAVSCEESETRYWLPQVAMRNGELALQRGMHQEMGWERRTDSSGMTLLVYSDHVTNPIMEAAGNIANGSGAEGVANLLFDRVSGLMRAAGPDFSSVGMMATLDRRLPGGNNVHLAYANGDAMVMPASTHAVGLAQLLTSARPRHAQTYTISLSGTLEGTGTRWRASYRWQPADSVTPIAPFAVGSMEPYLNLHLRQPIRLHREGMSIDALLDVRNLLAEGYQPFLLNDGSLLVFAQDQRSIRGGVAFTF